MYRAGAEPPKPPAGMSAKGRSVWREIIASKPTGYFDAGSLGILRLHCETMARAEQVSRQLAKVEVRSPEFRELVGLNKTLMASCATSARQLRLTVQQNVDRKSGLLDERGHGAADDELLGGVAVWGPPN